MLLKISILLHKMASDNKVLSLAAYNVGHLAYVLVDSQKLRTVKENATHFEVL